MCIYSLILQRFDLYSVILFCCFYGGNRGKPTGKIHFSRLRVRSASLAGLRMRIRYQNNGGSNISKRDNSELWRDCFRNCAPVSLGEQRILMKFLSIDSCENYVVTRGVQRFEYIGFGKVIWCQQNVSTQKARVPRTYVWCVAENKDVPDRKYWHTSGTYKYANYRTLLSYVESENIWTRRSRSFLIDVNCEPFKLYKW